MYAINVPWEQSNNMLQWAVENRVQMRITLRLAREWMEVASQFVDCELLQTLTVRKVSSPWTDRMLAGQLLPCSFRRGHKKYLFVSGVLTERTVDIDGKPQEAYVLAWPEGLQQVQRRFYFRAAVPDQFNLAVRVWPGVPAIDDPPTDAPMSTGNLVDISAGGAQVELVDDETLKIEHSYLVEIELPQPEEPALVLAQVRRVQKMTKNDRNCYGLHFLSLDQSPRGRETLMRLARVANYFRSFLAPSDVASQANEFE